MHCLYQSADSAISYLGATATALLLAKWRIKYFDAIIELRHRQVILFAKSPLKI